MQGPRGQATVCHHPRALWDVSGGRGAEEEEGRIGGPGPSLSTKSQTRAQGVRGGSCPSGCTPDQSFLGHFLSPLFHFSLGHGPSLLLTLSWWLRDSVVVGIFSSLPSKSSSPCPLTQEEGRSWLSLTPRPCLSSVECFYLSNCSLSGFLQPVSPPCRTARALF